MFELAGKVAVVTGGNAGIGLGMAQALAKAGADVCIWGTSEGKNADALEKLRVHGTRVAALQCDVGDEAAVERAFADALSQLQHVDVVFANAGIIGSHDVKSFVDISADEWRRVLRVNLDGAFFTLRAAARHMIEARHGGSLIVTSSLAAVSGPPRNQHYAASKGGLIAMMQGLAVELARYKVRANAILPGWIDTAMTHETLHGQAFTENVLRRIPVRRWGTPDDFAGIAVYLASDASSYHTGDVFLIDGGYTKF